jgi:hypothetical protein
MECPICLEEMKLKFQIKSPCRHIFCVDCFFSLKDFCCPLCRKELKNFMSIELQNIIQKNNKFEKPKSNSDINLHSFIDFPPLG